MTPEWLRWEVWEDLILQELSSHTINTELMVHVLWEAHAYYPTLTVNVL